MKLTQRQRTKLRFKYGDRCAYCGCALVGKWHADRLKPVSRSPATGKMDYPERDAIGNMMPACAPCNIDKHSMSLEGWRKRLNDLPGNLERNVSAYRNALRFGLVKETPGAVVFHFESFAGPKGRI